METSRSLKGCDAEDRRTKPRCSGTSLLMLLTIDVMAFTFAAWLMATVPEAIELAADPANAGGAAWVTPRVLSSITWDCGRRLPPREVRPSVPRTGPATPTCH